MLAIGSLLWGMSAFAQSSAARLDYAGRLFDQNGNPFSGVISVRADIRVTVAGSPCVLYRREQMAGAADQVHTDGDGQFNVVIRTGVDTVDPTEYEAAGLGSILSLTQITPLSCQGGGLTFVPSSNPERIVEISVSLNNGTTWEVVDEQLASPAAQSFDTMAFAGYPIANFVYDNGDGKITRAKVETLLDSPYSANLRDFATSGTLAVSSLSLSSFGTLGSSVVSRDYANENLAGADATSLGTLGAGDANQFIMWDGTKWVVGAPPATATAGLTGHLQFNSGGTLGASANLNWNNVNAYLGVGTPSPGTALHVRGDGPPVTVQVANVSSRMLRFQNSAGATLAELGSNATYPFAIYPGAAGTPNLFMHADGRVGVGDSSMPINETSLYANRLTTNPVVDQNAGAYSAFPTYSASGSANVRGLFANVSPQANSGVVASGVQMGAETRAVVEAPSAGNFNFLTGLRTSAGSATGYSGTIGYAIGLQVSPERGSGVIGTLIGIQIDGNSGSASVLNEYGLMQVSSQARNEFGGRLAIGTTNVSNPSILLVERQQNADTSILVRNPGTGLAARAGINFENNVTLAGRLWTASSGYSATHLRQNLILESENTNLNLISSDEMRFFTGGRNVTNEALRITNGSVSIGYTGVDAKLGVQGFSGQTLKIVDGNQGAGKVLTSDANGQASWQTPAAGGGSVTATNLGLLSANTETHVMNYTAPGGGGGTANATASELNFSGTGGPQILSGSYGKLTVSGSPNSQYIGGGVLHAASASGSSVSNLNGLLGIVEIRGGSTVTTAAAGRFDFIDGGATNAYGIYVGSVNGTNKWSIYSNQPNAPVYVAGSMGLGVTVPSEKLEVSGVVYSNSGGFKFPDGSTQTTAAVATGTVIFIVPNATCLASTTCYTAPGMSSMSPSEIQVPVPRAGTIRAILVRTSTAQPGTGAISVTIRNNTVNGIGVGIPAGAAAGNFQGVGTMLFAAEDLISIRMQNLAGAVSANIVSISFVYE